MQNIPPPPQKNFEEVFIVTWKKKQEKTKTICCNHRHYHQGNIDHPGTSLFLSAEGNLVYLAFGHAAVVS